MPAAIATLEQLKASLAKGGQNSLEEAVDLFYSEISAPGYMPPILSAGVGHGLRVGSFARAGHNRPRNFEHSGPGFERWKNGGRNRPLLAPAFDGSPAMIGRRLNFWRVTKSCWPPPITRQSMPYTQWMWLYAQAVFHRAESWRVVKPYYSSLPAKLKRSVDYQLGVSLVYLNDGERALQFYACGTRRVWCPRAARTG